MTPAPAVLLAIATELAKSAKDSMPELREGEHIKREWFKDGVYCRETTLNDEVYIAQYDFKQRKCCQTKVCDRNSND